MSLNNLIQRGLFGILLLFTWMVWSNCSAPQKSEPPPSEGPTIHVIESSDEPGKKSPDEPDVFDGGHIQETGPKETHHSETTSEQTQHNHGHKGANCVQAECTTPPPASCINAQTLRQYNGNGTCHPTEDRCVFSFQDKTCPGTCRNGACLAPNDPCRTKTCDRPPASTCTNSSTQRSYKSSGTCKDGTCTYPHTERKCPHGCKGGTCLADPCARQKCTKPPGPKCINAKTLRSYQVPGRCTKGTCTYPHADQTCPRGCAKNRCNVGAGFSPLNPFRFLDTRGAARPLSNSTKCVQIAGKGGVPKTARAVYINVVAVTPTGPGFLTVYPKGLKRPEVSTLNYTTNDTIANGSIVKLGTGGELCVFVQTETHIIIDVSGYFGTDADYVPITPYRRLDTRQSTRPSNDSTSCVRITGSKGIPSTAKAVFVNIVAVNATGVGFLTAFAKGASRPTTSNLNYNTNQTIANGAIVQVGTGGEICFFTKTSTHVVLDVYGYFGSSSSLFPVGPKRRLDTRTGPMPGARTQKCYQVTRRDGIPSEARALAINIAAISPAQPGYFQVYPDGLPKPTTSQLNHPIGGARANNALVQPGTNGKICVYQHASSHYVIDIVGYWKGSAADPCRGVTCNNPPPTTCTGGKDLLSYTNKGTCRNGICIYPPNTKTCAYRCSGNRCIAAPPPPPPRYKYHPVTAWQRSSQPVTSGSRMNLLALRYITIHYNGGRLDLDGRDNVYQDSDFIQILRNTHSGYLSSRGYSLGYNSAIAPDGDEWEIRGLRYRCAANGCSAVNKPAYAIIIMLSSITATPTKSQIEGAKAAIARVRAAVKAAGNPHHLSINGHRDVRPRCGGGGTACPGDKLYRAIKNGTLK